MKEKKAKTTFTAREVGTLIEDLHAKFGTVVEQLRDLQEKIDTNTGMVAENRQELMMHGIRLSGIEGKITKINGKLAQIECRLGKVESKLGKIEEDVGVIKTDFSKRLTTLEASPK